MKKKFATVLAAILAIALLMTACVSGTPSAGLSDPPANKTVGTILLSVNPEIKIEYDSKGTVIALKGVNREGKEIVSQYQDYVGQPCDQVVTELVKKIYAAGYFEVELDGNARNIVIKLEEGSAYPGDDFLNKVATSVRAAVSNQGGQSSTMVVDKSDLNQNGLIGLEKAKELVLAQLGLTEADFTQKEYELDDGIYELEFTAGGVEYDYEVDGRTGKILQADMEHNNDWQEIPNPPSDGITLEEAKTLVFTHLGITEDQVTRKHYHFDDGKYELEFHYDGMEYDVDVDARTGTILQIDRERDDRYDDDWYDDDRYDDDDRDDRPANNSLTLEEAKQLVFTELGITASQVRDLEAEYDDGQIEVSFDYNGYEYEYRVNPNTGAVTLTDKEPMDD